MQESTNNFAIPIGNIKESVNNSIFQAELCNCWRTISFFQSEWTKNSQTLSISTWIGKRISVQFHLSNWNYERICELCKQMYGNDKRKVDYHYEFEINIGKNATLR